MFEGLKKLAQLLLPSMYTQMKQSVSLGLVHDKHVRGSQLPQDNSLLMPMNRKTAWYHDDDHDERTHASC